MRHLQGGLISRVTIHAIDTKGNHKVVAVNGAGDNVYWLWLEARPRPHHCVPSQSSSRASRQNQRRVPATRDDGKTCVDRARRCLTAIPALPRPSRRELPRDISDGTLPQ